MNNDIVHINFIIENKEIKSDFDFKKSNTAREVIITFLRETNSIMNYKVDAITFMTNAMVLNSDKNLDKPLSKLIKKSVLKEGNIRIKVFETENIIGGLTKNIDVFIF